MSRKPKGIHTSPDKAGEQNITPEIKEKFKATSEMTESLRKVLNMERIRQPYKGQWTEEEFQKSLDDFFEYCSTNDMEIAKPLLQIWLRVDRQKLHEWEKNDTSFKHDLIKDALARIEYGCYQTLNSKPLPNMFKLKTSFGYVESTKVEVITGDGVDVDAINDLVNRLGLAKE